jgi:hypothetical protein
MHQQVTYKTPPVTVKYNGRPRLVGFELEFSGLTLDQTVKTIESSLGGKPGKGTAAEQVIHVESLGDFNVELDWNYLKRKAQNSDQKGESGDWIEQLSKAASLIVPMEVVCPPIEIHNLDALDPMVSALRKAGAVGTDESVFAAYGVHINTEIHHLDAATLFSYIRAFSLLQWWLVEAHAVDTARKISPYIELYPENYIGEMLSRSNPDIDTVCTDYLEYNATRNRALDMLPLLAELDEQRIRSAVDDPRIKARPAFHYRLPNCNIEQENWSLSQSWNKWCIIEQLAHRADDLDKLGLAFLRADRPILGVRRNDWVEYIDQWLKNHELA